MSVPTGFDDLDPSAARLSVVALLAATEWAGFAFVRDSLSLSDSALSKQLHTLEEAGYLGCARWAMAASGVRTSG